MKSVWIFPSHIPPGYCREYNLEPGSRQELNYGLEWKGLRFLFTYSVLRPGRTGHLAILLSEDKHSNFRQHNGWKSLIFWVPLRSLSTSFSWITQTARKCFISSCITEMHGDSLTACFCSTFRHTLCQDNNCPTLCQVQYILFLLLFLVIQIFGKPVYPPALSGLPLSPFSVIKQELLTAAVKASSNSPEFFSK